ncbi:MAG: DUF3488 and transglutaminase-like domain-containing protein [Halofilum sp. (in: g-proteobacteria)]
MSSDALSTPVLRGLAASVLVAAIPHATHLPVWVSALIPAALMLRLGLRRPPARWLLVLLVLLCFAAVLARFHTIAGATAGGAFLSAMIALKFLETRNTRDAGLLICLTYFLAVSVFLTSESMATTAWVLASVGVTTVTLLILAAPEGPSLRQHLVHTGRILLQAAPIMLVLFVLFPRLPQPLWGMESGSTARTGLSDTMEPGSITQVIQSSEAAFRVEFAEGEPPAPPHYWRGPVFWQFDGRTWAQGERRSRELAEPEITGTTIEYTLMLAPHDRRWLFGLDLPLGADAEHERAAGYHLLAPEDVESVRRLQMRSALHYRLEPELPASRRQRALELPAQAAPLARELAARWRVEAEEPRDIVDQALTHFRERDFSYTLSPPATGEAPVDDFLFRTQSGYCEHYASAFTVLMRAAGIPARVVTGYLGGETNDMGDYMLVRQSDAHAWSEVWLPERGWTRVDPTQAVSSERVESGAGSVAGADDQLALLSRSDGWLKQAALAWDAVHHTWNRVVVGYGPEMQQRLLQRLGLADLGRYAMAVLAIMSAGVALAGVWLLTARRPAPMEPAQRYWSKALARLRRAGIEPALDEGPRDLAARVRRERPDLAPAFGRVVHSYIALRYRPQVPEDALARLRRAVHAFRPRKRAHETRTAERAGTQNPQPVER